MKNTRNRIAQKHIRLRKRSLSNNPSVKKSHLSKRNKKINQIKRFLPIKKNPIVNKGIGKSEAISMPVIKISKLHPNNDYSVSSKNSKNFTKGKHFTLNGKSFSGLKNKGNISTNNSHNYLNRGKNNE